MTRRDIRDRIFKIVFTLEFNDAEGMQDQLDLHLTLRCREMRRTIRFCTE